METTAIENRLREPTLHDPQRAMPNPHTPEVLVVDDHPMNRFVVAEMLGAMGANSTCAHDGHSALQMAKAQRFDLILMDLQMPGLDGYTTTRLLQDTPGLRVPPVIGLTASFNPAELGEHRAAGLDDCFSKPLRPEDLARILADTCQPKPTPEEVPEPVTLADADWQECLRIAGGREALARDLLVIMLETLAPSTQDIQLAAREYHWPALAAAIHRLLGACRYTGAPRLTDLCERLQTACNHHDRTELRAQMQCLESVAEQFAIKAGDLLGASAAETTDQPVELRDIEAG